jgi:predicted metal-dependent hydrolase
LLPFGDKYNETLAHYVPIKEDLSDLIQKIQWCRDNDKKCEQIAKNGLDFFRTYLQKDGVLQYMQKILVNLKKEMGTYLYNSKTPLQIIIEDEYKNINRSFPTIQKNIKDLSICPPMERCYGILQGMEFVVRKIIAETNFENVALFGNKIFENSLKTVIVKETKLAGFSMVVKTTSESQKIEEHIHEAFVGIMSINKLLKFIPNFAYIFGLYENKENGSIKLTKDKVLKISIPERNDYDRQKLIRSLLIKFTQKYFLPIITERVNHYNQTFFKQQINGVRLKYNKSNWGSCSTGKNLNFSVRLFFAPDDVIDYVVIHELAHLLEMNHSERFWKIVSDIKPDYQIKEKMLKTNSAKYEF